MKGAQAFQWHAMGKRVLLARVFGWSLIVLVLGACTDNAHVPVADAGTRSGERGEENSSDEVASSQDSGGPGAVSMSGAEGSGQSEPSDVDDCALRCNDGFSCTIDSCRDGDCVYTLAPLDDPGACPRGEYCTLEQGCVAAPPCADDVDCEEAWADDACKQSPRCDAASSVCVFSILDKDRDGHAPLICGGGDCNDDDFALSPREEDVCDTVDNNCDGEVDDGIDLGRDPTNCGECGQVCPGATTGVGTCVTGQCECPPQNSCVGDCVDITNNPNHCGGCSNRCPDEAACEQGECACPTGQVVCADSCASSDVENCPGTCADLSVDVDNCGSCGNACLMVESCVDGSCEPCVEETPECERASACELTQCGSEYETCFGGAALGDFSQGDCLSLSACIRACGCDKECWEGCSTSAFCWSCLDILGVCTSEACASDTAACAANPSCPVGQTRCDDVCADLTQDSDHCGGCGNRCSSSGSCEDGVCRCGTTVCSPAPTGVLVCSPGRTMCGGDCVDIEADSLNCGACGSACSEARVCANGTCQEATANGGNGGNGESDPPAGGAAGTGGGAAEAETLRFIQVSAGLYHACGLKDDGTVVCWGRDDRGQATPPAESFTAMSVGGLHTCGITGAATILCWGDDTEGQASPPSGTFSQVSSGESHTCGLMTDGSVTCWGYNVFGQTDAPVGTFFEVAAGGFHTCGLASDGSAVCWGRNDEGQVTPPADTFATIVTGSHHSCGLTIENAQRCWGSSDFGQWEDPNVFPITGIAAGGHQTCLLGNFLGCVGENLVTPPRNLGPYQVVYEQVSLGNQFGCAVANIYPDYAGVVICWGLNDFGQTRPPASNPESCPNIGEQEWPNVYVQSSCRPG